MTEPDTPGAGSYSAAIVELESILRELERENVDVDHLTSRVRRASDLIRACRSKIDATRLEIDQIVAGIDREDEEPPPPYFTEPADAADFEVPAADDEPPF